LSQGGTVHAVKAQLVRVPHEQGLHRGEHGGLVDGAPSDLLDRIEEHDEVRVLAVLAPYRLHAVGHEGANIVGETAEVPLHPILQRLPEGRILP
jgi:hypothetical protein